MRKGETMRKVAAVCLVWVLLAVVPAFGAVATQESLAQKIEAILDAEYPADEPGVAVIVVDDGEVVYRGARGLADMENGLPLTPDSVFRLGSITKQFTAAAIMLLVEREELSLDDPLTKFIPDYPTNGETVTVEHLLTHTSGIVSYTGIPGYMATEVRKDLTTDELIDVFKGLETEFSPGEEWKYNNSGYVLLGAIIERVSGQSYEEFIEENIFDPLGMDNSYYGSHSRLIPHRARGYAGGPGNWGNAPYLSMTQPHAAGSLLSTVDDLAKWDAALFGGKLLKPSSVEKMATDYRLSDGEPTGYGYGLAIGTLRNSATISHGGGIHGFSTFATRLPGDDLYVAVLANSSGGGTNPTMMGNEIAALAIGRPFPRFSAVELDPAILGSYVGVYKIDEDTERVVSAEDGRLYTQRTGGNRLEAFPHSETGFFYKGSHTHFELVKNDSGKVTKMLMYQDGSDEAEPALRVSDTVPEQEVAEIDPAIYDRYVGKYELRPGFVVTVTREEDRIFVQATGQPRFELFPRSATEFFLKAVAAEIVFVVDGEGPATELVLHQGGRELPGKRTD